MVKIRSASKAGVTAKFIGGRFLLLHDGITETVAVEHAPIGDVEISQVLESILNQR